MKNHNFLDFVYLDSPLGLLELYASDSRLVEVRFGDKKIPKVESSLKILKQAQQELIEYFAGKRFVFTVPTMQTGTAFQTAIWQQLAAIPYAKTISYAKLASAVGKPKACRAVGITNGLNKLPIIIPCHRVVGKNGSIGGYSAGVWRKEWLLCHEQKHKLVLGD